MAEKEQIFRLIPIKDKSESHKFECCVTWKNKLYIGLNEGNIMLYLITPKNDREWTVKGERIEKTPHTGKPIQQMIVVAEIGVLLVLVNGVIQQHHLEDATAFTERCQLPNLRECMSMTVKKDKGKFIIAALTKKKILLYDWKESKVFGLMKELNIVEGCNSLTWCGKKLLLGIKNEFVLLDTKTCELDALFETDQANCPVANMPPMKELLIAQSSAGVRVTLEGQPMDPGLTWSSLPTHMGYCHPYLLSVHDGNSVDIHCPFVQAPSANSGIPAAQTLTLKYVNQLSMCSFVNFDAAQPEKNPSGYSIAKAEVRRDMIVAITTVSSVVLLDMIPIAEQAAQACIAKRFDHALRLCALCPGEVNDQDINDIRLRYGIDFFQKKKYAEAVEQFGMGDADPRFVASLLPGFLPQSVESKWKSPFGKSVKLDVKDLTQAQRNEALQAIITYLQPKRRPPSPPPAPARDKDAGDKDRFASDRLTGGSLLGSADDIKPKEKTPMTEDDKMIQNTIDTALLRAYVELGRDLDVTDFLQKPNHCVAEDCELLLRQRSEFVALVTLWLSNKEYQKALDVCRQLGMHGLQDSNLFMRSTLAGTPLADFLDHPQGLRRSEFPKTFLTQSAIQKRISDFLVRHPLQGVDEEKAEELQRKMERQFIGIMMTIHALKMLPTDVPNAEFMYADYCKWILANVDPSYSLEIFNGANIKVEPRDVIKLLKSEDMKNGMVMPAEVQARYIEMVLGPNMNANEDVDLHNKRVEALVKLMSNVNRRSEAKAALSKMLEISVHYEPPLVITWLTADPQLAAALSKERAIVYRRMKDHSSTIEMYVNETNDLEAAKEYAKMVSQEEEEDAFKLLLKHLLHPAGGARTSRLGEALDVVNKCPGVDARTALPMLPDETPLHEIREFLKKAIRETSARRRSKEVHHNVLKSLQLQTKVECSKLKKKSVVIDSSVTCKKCNRRIADAVFARFPNGVVVHQACQENSYTDPVSGKDFRRTALLESYHHENVLNPS